MTRRECGELRRMHRAKIRAYLLMYHRLTLSGLAEEIGVSVESVSATIRGKMHSPKVLGALRGRGVPEKYLFDPRKCGKEAA